MTAEGTVPSPSSVHQGLIMDRMHFLIGTGVITGTLWNSSLGQSVRHAFGIAVKTETYGHVSQAYLNRFLICNSYGKLVDEYQTGGADVD